MSTNGQYLRPVLDAGSSRVFNCNDITRKLLRDKDENPYIFQTPAMHNLVVLKEVIGPDDPKHPHGCAVGTKLYLPYDSNDVYDGGRSIFFHSRDLMRMFHEQFGFDPQKAQGSGFNHDLQLMRTLDSLPSLDGFLMRDALQLEGFALNEAYFEVSPAERAAIQDFIRGNMECLVRAAFGGKAPSASQVSSLTDKIWEAKDLEALDPLIQAFRFPKDKALSIFSGWKGIIFYSFEYHRSRERREALALWLKSGALPSDVVPKDVREWLDGLRRGAIHRLRNHWVDIDGLLKRFDAVYKEFVASSNPGGFIDFLQKAGEIYRQLGDSLSKINHSINCWDIVTRNYMQRRMPSERLAELLDLMRAILIPAVMARPAQEAA